MYKTNQRVQYRYSISPEGCHRGSTTRDGWKGTVSRVGYKHLYVAWDNKPEGTTRYVKAHQKTNQYIFVIDEETQMRNHTENTDNFFMVVSEDGDLKSAKITEEEANLLAYRLAEDSIKKESFYVIKPVRKMGTKKPKVSTKEL